MTHAQHLLARPAAAAARTDSRRLLTHVLHCCTTYNNVIRISALRAEAAIGAATAAPGGAIAAPASPPIGPVTVGRSGPFDDDEVV